MGSGVPAGARGGGGSRPASGQGVGVIVGAVVIVGLAAVWHLAVKVWPVKRAVPGMSWRMAWVLSGPVDHPRPPMERKEVRRGDG